MKGLCQVRMTTELLFTDLASLTGFALLSLLFSLPWFYLLYRLFKKTQIRMVPHAIQEEMTIRYEPYTEAEQREMVNDIASLYWWLPSDDYEECVQVLYSEEEMGEQA